MFEASLTVFSSPVAAQSAVFMVTGVPIDARGGTTTEARAKGLQNGQIQALDLLYRRLVPRGYQFDLPTLSGREVIDVVRDFSVSDERTSSGRYLANLTVRFRPESVRSVLRFSGVPFAETVSKPVAVIPVYQESVVSDPVIWSDSNQWIDAWGQLAVATGLVPRQLPFGDLEDLSRLSIEDVVARDADQLMKWASRYGADDVVIATASLISSLGADSVRVTLYFTRTGIEKTVVIPATGGQAWPQLFEASASQAWELVEDEWKRENMLQFDVTGQITALVPLTALEGWLTVKTRLKSVPLIDRYELQAITRDRAQVMLHYLGDESQLKLAMAQSDLGFVRQDEVWVIEDRASASSALETLGAQGSMRSMAPEQTAYPPSGLFSNGISGSRP